VAGATEGGNSFPQPPKPDAVRDGVGKVAYSYQNIEQTKREIDRYVKPRIGSLPLPELDHDVVQNLFHSLRGTPAIANHVRSHISAAFNYARSKKYVDRGSPNPCQFVKLFKLKKHKRIIKGSEYSEISEAMSYLWEQKPGYRPELLCLEFLMLTGCRIQEAKRLKWAEVDLTNGRIVLEEHKTIEKSDEDKVIPIVSPVEDVLKRAAKLRKELGFISPYVFPHIKKKGRRPKTEHVDGSVRRVWDLINEHAKTTVRRKNFRSSYISRGGQQGYNVELISKVVHHATPQTTLTYYLDFEEQQKRQAAEQIADSIRADME